MFAHAAEIQGWKNRAEKAEHDLKVAKMTTSEAELRASELKNKLMELPREKQTRQE